jgi:Flp pilus assembly pilin Flp
MTALIRKLWSDESGQGLPEYALLVAAVVVMVVAASTLFSQQVQNLFNAIGNYITTSPNAQAVGAGG